MWNDEETNIDLLGHRTLASTICNVIKEDRIAPLTIGVFGDWGVGKSSVLTMICEEMNMLPNTCCIKFNGWLFQGYEDAKSALMESIISELQSKQPTNAVLKNKAMSLIKRVNWLKLAKKGADVAWFVHTGTPSPTSLMEVFGKVKEYFAKPTEGDGKDTKNKEELNDYFNKKITEDNSLAQEIHGFRKDFEELLEAAKVNRLVVLMDDLDRCMPDTAIDTLEAMKLFFFVKGTVFVLAADEEMIVNAVKNRFPTLAQGIGNTDYTRNYLEKLIQIPFRIPPTGKTEARTYITLLLAENALLKKEEDYKKILSKASETFSKPWEGKRLDEAMIREVLSPIPEELKAPLLLADRISSVLTEGLKGNPRQIKRFLNTLMLRRRMAIAQGIDDLVQEDALAKFMLLERFAENIFKDIVERIQMSADGKLSELKKIEEFVERKSLTKKSAPISSELPSGWAENSWLLAWAHIQPNLGDIDLRPYVYISREKTPSFVSPNELGELLDNIANKLINKSKAIQISAKSDLKTISFEDARKLFKYCEQLARKKSVWRSKPSEVEALYILCDIHNELQDDLITLLENIPVSALGSWAPVGLKTILTTEQSKNRYSALIKKWGEQKENSALSNAVKAGIK